jgi:hypothetical protein
MFDNGDVRISAKADYAVRAALLQAVLPVAAIALVACGDDGSKSGGSGAPLELRAVPGEDAEAFRAAPQLDSSGAGAGSVVYALEAPRVESGEPLVVTYDLVGSGRARARLAGRRGSLELAPGRGKLKIATDGVPAGRHELRVAIAAARPIVERVEVGG